MPYSVWEKTVPRISDMFLQCAVYVYASLEDAKLGEHQGGSGFLVHVRFDQNRDWSEVYVVTNRHVVIGAKTPVVRMNRKDGDVEYISTDLSQWTLHQDGDDIAVLPIRFRYEEVRYWSVASELFLSHPISAAQDVGIGDEAFMVGRFINHEGAEKNAPSVRFGTIAMMPTERIHSPYGIDQESFLVEVRSLPGYSGSAVFLYTANAMNDMSMMRDGIPRPADIQFFGKGSNALEAVRFLKPKGPYLLGIDWCHIPRRAPVRNASGSPVDGDWYVEENTGMAGVIPAWKIMEVLNCEELVMQRKEADSKMTRKKAASPVSLDSATPESKPFTKQDFENALTKASRKVTPEPKS